MKFKQTIDEKLNFVATWKVAPNSNFDRLLLFYFYLYKCVNLCGLNNKTPLNIYFPFKLLKFYYFHVLL